MNQRALLLLLLLAPSARAESFKAWAARAGREERAKDSKAAFQSYSNALTSWKESDGSAGKAKVLCARAALRDRGGDETGALADYSDCVAIDKKNAKILARRGELRLKVGKISPAIDDFYRAIAIDIKFASAYLDRARAYEALGDRGFAAEDYRRACELGVKAACPKAKELAPARKGGAKKTAMNAPAAAAPAPVRAKKSAKKKVPYKPLFADCLGAVQSCIDKGSAYGACVAKAPSCERTEAKGCCPAACLKAYSKALDGGESEASAYRGIFNSKASCAASH